jgi:hypothetical protein
VPITISLGVVIGLLAIAVVASLIRERQIQNRLKA